VTTVSTLDFLRDVVKEHVDRLEDSALTVFPCVHDDANTDDDAALFTAAIRRAGGIYVRCSPDLDNWRVPAPLNEQMARHLESFCAQRNTPVKIREVDGDVRVTVHGSDALTAASATLGQVLALLCSAHLSNNAFVVYSYPLDGLDESRAALLWEAGRSIKNFPTDRLQTLVFVACGNVSVMNHCNPLEGAARLVVRSGELIRRQARHSPDMRTGRILRSLDKPVVLFLGAGASASSNVPQGDTLRDVAISNLTGVTIASPDLLQSFRQYLEDNPSRYMTDERLLTRYQFERSLTLERVLREEFHALGGRSRRESTTVKRMTADCNRALERVPPGRAGIWELAQLVPRLILATVNFDELIETDMPASHHVVASVAEFAAAGDLVTARVRGETEVVPILKVHGTIADPDTLVADIDETTRGLPAAIETVLDLIVSDAGPVTWAWIGCSMRDVDLRQWLRRKDGVNQLEEFWIDPLPPRSLADYVQEVRERQWAVPGQSLFERQVTESSDVFLPALLERAKILRGSET
jgi:hypothetical protein